MILPNLSERDTSFWFQQGGNKSNANDDCSDVLVFNDSTVIAAHNEDKNVPLLDHTLVLDENSKSRQKRAEKVTNEKQFFSHFLEVMPLENTPFISVVIQNEFGNSFPLLAFW